MPQLEVDRAAASLVKQGLAERIFITEEVTWLGLTTRGAHVVTELDNRPNWPG
jgi:hypothetical protein